jgi:hypothetical protein
MTFDFRADQTRTGRIISSGSAPLLIYPSSSALNLQGDLTGFSTSSVGTDVFLYVSGSTQKKTVFGGDVRVSGALTASVRTVDGTNQFIVGDGITVSFNSLGQWALTGSVPVAGSDQSVQFNQNNVLTGSASFAFASGTMSVATISGNNVAPFANLGLSPGLQFSSNIAQSNGFFLIDGSDPVSNIGGFAAGNGAGLAVFSGALGDGQAGFSLYASPIASLVSANHRGDYILASGSFSIVSPIGRALSIYSGPIETEQPKMFVTTSIIPGEMVLTLTGAVTASRINSPQITGSIKSVSSGGDFILGRRIQSVFNTSGQWELTGAIQRVSIAGYSRANLTSPTVIGYAYIDPTEHPAGASLSIEAVGMNMGGVSGGLAVYNQTNGTTLAALTWSGTSTLTTGSYQTAVASMPASATSYEIHLSQSGGVSGGSNYTSVGFVNFRVS